MIFLIRTEENSTFWTVLHTHIIEAAIMASNSYSFTQISTGSQIRWSAKLAAMMDKRWPALHREGGGEEVLKEYTCFSGVDYNTVPIAQSLPIRFIVCIIEVPFSDTLIVYLCHFYCSRMCNFYKIVCCRTSFCY